MTTIQTIAACFKPYITIRGLVPGQTYRYAKREKSGPVFHPVVDIFMHSPKSNKHSIVYMAVKAGAQVSNLTPGEKLYVGSQSGADRMFRGDSFDVALNFHHKEMRKGRGQANLIRYLEGGGKVDIYAAQAPDLCAYTAATPQLESLSMLLRGDIAFTEKTHLKYQHHAGYWIEQLILREENESWAWNTKGVDSIAESAFRLAGI